uniref:uncharacterized protein isoform X1 n=2 Tax=Pristiophorus japonicus TaxID=55135 RepID=UPI00398E7A76
MESKPVNRVGPTGKTVIILTRMGIRTTLLVIWIALRHTHTLDDTDGQQSTLEVNNHMNYGVLFNVTDGVCVPVTKDWSKDRTYFNSWLQVNPNKNRVCVQCSTGTRGSCIKWRDAKGPDECTFSIICAPPEQSQQSVIRKKGVGLCGYYEEVGAAAISLYVCFSPSPTPRPIRTTTLPEELPCPTNTKGPENGIVLYNEEELLYDNVKHEIVPVLINISCIQMPEYCTEQSRKMYNVLSKVVMQQAADAMGANRFRGQESAPRIKREIDNYVAPGFNAGTSVVNSLGIQGLNKRLEQLKRLMKGLFESVDQNQEDQANLGKEGAEIQLDGISVLEAHAKTINHLIDREREDTGRQRQGQLYHAYGLWMVGQIRHNLDQIRLDRQFTFGSVGQPEGDTG